jgi:hypothetical protein
LWLQAPVPRTPVIHHAPRISAFNIPPQFHSTLSRLLATSKPITHVSICEFIAVSLTSHHTKGHLDCPLTVTPVTPRGSIYTLSLDGNPFIGLGLQSHDKEEDIDNVDKKTCPFGCLVNNKHQHLWCSG